MVITKRAATDSDHLH